MSVAQNVETRADASRQEMAGKYLTFALGAEEYGLPVLRVREIIKIMDITAVPQVPAYVKGVINLRGKVIPVIDLRLKFSFPEQDYTERTSIIVVEVNLSGGKVLMGVIVDAVSEVLNISVDEVESTPTFGQDVSTEYMKGMAKVKGRVKILLDLDKVFEVDGAVAMPQAG